MTAPLPPGQVSASGAAGVAARASTLAMRQEAARRLLALKRAQTSYEGFVRLVHPDWIFPSYQLWLMRVLDLFERGVLRLAHIDQLRDDPELPELDLDTASPILNNLLVTMPPRFAKSTHCTVHFPAYLMGRDPRRFIMTTSYNHELANGFGREVRNLTQDPEVQAAFPDLALAKDSQASDVWHTTAKGAYYGIGLGGTTSGRAANFLIIDDPIKSRKEADSLTKRKDVWDYYSSALSTRLQPDSDGAPPKQLVILTRWHPDDLAGRLMASDDWKDGLWGHINMPAIVDANTPVERALWPERFPLEALKRREKINPREFAALYQQTPYIAGGNLFRQEWWQTTPDDITADIERGEFAKHFVAIVVSADTAFKTKESNDYSVITIGGLTASGDIHILNVMRGRWEYPDLRQRLIATNALLRGKGLRGLYIEDKASGQSLIQDLRRETGLAVIPHKVTHDKSSRANLVTPLIEGGRVFLPRTAPWLDAFIEETSAFPSAPHDDIVDSLVICLDAMSRMRVTPSGQDINLLHSAPLAPTQDSLAAKLASLVGHKMHLSANIPGAVGHVAANQPYTPIWKGWGE
jgi:predicted phage terminase large subunit-like protein